MIKGQIIKSTGGLYEVLEENGSLWTTKPRGVFRKTGNIPYVGDYAAVEPLENNTGTIVEIFPRSNVLSRPPIANLDVMVLVVSVMDPVPNFVTIDKFLAMMDSHGIPAVIAVTKPDHGDPLPLKEMYEKAGYPVFVINSLEGGGEETLKIHLQGKLAAFSGNTGAGKSSLINILDTAMNIQTGETSKKLGRGKHTTRHVEIFTLESGLRIADTPGFTALDLIQITDITRDSLDEHFIDFVPHIPSCRFNDCTHRSEISCGVKKSVEEGTISTSRYESYLTIFDEIKDVAEWERR